MKLLIFLLIFSPLCQAADQFTDCILTYDAIAARLNICYTAQREFCNTPPAWASREYGQHIWCIGQSLRDIQRDLQAISCTDSCLDFSLQLQGYLSAMLANLYRANAHLERQEFRQCREKYFDQFDATKKLYLDALRDACLMSPNIPKSILSTTP